jgi:hypothetical protein
MAARRTVMGAGLARAHGARHLRHLDTRTFSRRTKTLYAVQGTVGLDDVYHLSTSVGMFCSKPKQAVPFEMILRDCPKNVTIN